MKGIKNILSGEILRNDFLRKNVKLLLLLFLIFFTFVITDAIGEMKIAEKQKIKKEITELKEKSVFLSSELMQQSLVNEVFKQIKARKIGLVKLSEPPKIVKISSDEEKE